MAQTLQPFRSSRVPAWVQVSASLLALAATLWLVDRSEIWRRLQQIHIGWLCLTLAVLLAQYLLLAARWCFLARRLSTPLAYRRALGMYFLAGLLNQVLPFGILGDVARAIRHSRRARQSGSAPDSKARVVLAILFERASGQIALWLTVVIVLPGWWAAATNVVGTSSILQRRQPAGTASAAEVTESTATITVPVMPMLKWGMQ